MTYYDVDSLKELVVISSQIFVLVKISPGNSIYLQITKVALNEYLKSIKDLNIVFCGEFNDSKELFLGCS